MYDVCIYVWFHIQNIQYFLLLKLGEEHNKDIALHARLIITINQYGKENLCSELYFRRERSWYGKKVIHSMFEEDWPSASPKTSPSAACRRRNMGVKQLFLTNSFSSWPRNEPPHMAARVKDETRGKMVITHVHKVFFSFLERRHVFGDVLDQMFNLQNHCGMQKLETLCSMSL